MARLSGSWMLCFAIRKLLGVTSLFLEKLLKKIIFHNSFFLIGGEMHMFESWFWSVCIGESTSSMWNSYLYSKQVLPQGCVPTQCCVGSSFGRVVTTLPLLVSAKKAFFGSACFAAREEKVKTKTLVRWFLQRNISFSVAGKGMVFGWLWRLEKLYFYMKKGEREVLGVFLAQLRAGFYRSCQGRLQALLQCAFVAWMGVGDSSAIFLHGSLQPE